ncbi:hypothetical protein JCM10212_002500 [Sporobolomyces blumeae]
MVGQDATDEELALRQADELLAQDDPLGSPHHPPHHHRRASSIGSTVGLLPFSNHATSLATTLPTSARDLVASLTVLVLSSTLATYQVRPIAQHSKSIVLLYPVLHFAALGGLGLALGYVRPHGVFGRQGSGVSSGGGGAGTAGGLSLGRGGGTGSTSRTMTALAGFSCAASFVLRLWTARRNDDRLCQAVDVFVLPTILLLLPYVGPRLNLGSFLQTAPSTTFSMTLIVSTFMAGFALIGIRGSSAKLMLAVLRLPFEGLALILLKEGLSDEATIKPFLLGTAVSAVATCLATLPLAAVLAVETYSPNPTVFSLVWTLLVSVGSTVALLFALYLFSSPLTAGSTLFGRNWLLLVIATFGTDVKPIRDNWLQIAFVYAFGAVAVAWADPEVSSAVRAMSSQQKPGGAYAALDRNGSAGSAPSSPALPSTGTPSLGNRKSSSDRVPQSSSSSGSSPFASLLTLAPFFPLFVHLLQTPMASMNPFYRACSALPPSLQSALYCPNSALAYDSDGRSVDIVISYYNEDLNAVRDHLDAMRKLPFCADRKDRVVVYNKGERAEGELRNELRLYDYDEVVPLENVGREGETYLKHILLHYNGTLLDDSPSSSLPLPPSLSEPLKHLRRHSLATHTFFLQPHLAWDWVARKRLDLVSSDTGFAHLGPLIPGTCGRDDKVGVDFPLWTQLYNIFTGGLCPPGGQTMAWSGQFVVSKRRILANSYDKYAYVDGLMSAPLGHWIHDMWGPNESGGPSNPAFGHSVERAWPAVFACADAKYAKECPDDVANKVACTCLDQI